MMANKKLVSIAGTQCEGVIPNNNTSSLKDPYGVLVKAYDDGSTVPLGCKYAHMNGSGEYLCDPHLSRAYGSLNKCRFNTI